MNEKPDITSVETDVQKAARYRKALHDALAEHVLPLMNAAKADGLRLNYQLADSGFGWGVSPISVDRPL